MREMESLGIEPRNRPIPESNVKANTSRARHAPITSGGFRDPLQGSSELEHMSGPDRCRGG